MMLLFSANQGMNDAAFICPRCLDQPEGYTRDVITQEIRSILGRVTSLLSGGEATPFEISQSPLPEEGSPQLLNQQLLGRSLENVQWHEGSVKILQRPRNEKYNGFDKSVIHGLVRTLDECIFNYNKEVCDVIEAFGDPGDEALNVPLKTWQVIDAKAAILAGQEWHQITDGSMNPTKGHTPITASLRKMLEMNRDSPLEIAASLENLKFSQVHKAFVSWFVIDVLGNKLDIFELPNMKPVRAMMTGVHQFGEESTSTSKLTQFLWLTCI
jgi:putative sterol carrier protein